MIIVQNDILCSACPNYKEAIFAYVRIKREGVSLWFIPYSVAQNLEQINIHIAAKQ
jgi:hypothetical protein